MYLHCGGNATSKYRGLEQYGRSKVAIAGYPFGKLDIPDTASEVGDTYSHQEFQVPKMEVLTSIILNKGKPTPKF